MVMFVDCQMTVEITVVCMLSGKMYGQQTLECLSEFLLQKCSLSSLVNYDV